MEERSFLKPALSLAMLAAGLVMSAVGVDWFAPVGVRAAWYAVAFLPVGLGVIREAWECAAKGDVFSEFMLMSVAAVGALCSTGLRPTSSPSCRPLYCINSIRRNACARSRKRKARNAKRIRRAISRRCGMPAAHRRSRKG